LQSDRAYWSKIAKENGINQAAFDNRIYLYGYDYEEAATKPLGNQGYYNDLLEKAHANVIMLTYKGLYNRIKKLGMSEQEAITKPLQGKRN